MVGGGTALSFERVVIAEDPDNIPLVLLSVKALSKDGVTLVDQTPSWLEATTSGETILIDEKFIYRLTVTVEIDAEALILLGGAEGGEGTYLIELRAQVADASKAVIVCQFNVCVTGTVVVSDVPNLAALYAQSTSPFFRAANKTTCADLGTLFTIGATEQAWTGLAYDASRDIFVYVRHNTPTNNSQVYTVEPDGTNDTNRVDVTNAGGTRVSGLTYDPDADLLFLAKPGVGGSGQIIEVIPDAWTQSVIFTSSQVSGDCLALDTVAQKIYYADDGVMEIREITYLGGGDQQISSAAQISAAGVAAGAIVGLEFIPAAVSSSGADEIYATTDQGELFTVLVSSGVASLLLLATEWTGTANIGGRLHWMRRDGSDVFVAASQGSVSDDFIYRLTLGDELNNTRCWEVGTTIPKFIGGFDLFRSLTGS